MDLLSSVLQEIKLVLLNRSPHYLSANFIHAPEISPIKLIINLPTVVFLNVRPSQASEKGGDPITTGTLRCGSIHSHLESVPDLEI